MRIIFTLISAAAFTFLVSFTTRLTGKAGYVRLPEKIETNTRYRELLLDINETVDSINAMLHRFSEYQSLVSVNIAGTIIITNNNMQFFHFNLADLASLGNGATGFGESGITTVHSGDETNTAGNRINFNTMRGTVAYIKLTGAGNEDMEQLHQLFIHLRASMMEIISA
jgi:hypothetical protein